MFTDLRIKNFRLFDDLKIKGLRRINLFVGENNSGKTAVLEAVAMVAAGDTPDVFNMNSFRGETMPKSEVAFREYLKLFFKDLDNTRGFEIRAAHTDQGVRQIKATVEQKRESVVSDDRKDSGLAAGRPDCILKLALSDGYDRSTEFKAFFAEGKIRAIGGPTEGKEPPLPVVAEYIPPNIDLSYSDADRLSELRRQKRTDGIRNALRRFEPKVKNVPEVLVSEGTTKVFCDIGTQELMPLGIMGEGTARLLRLLVRMERPAASNAEDGRAFIVDEIENGFHHETLVHVWRMLDEASRRNATQVFAATHNRECMVAAHQAIDIDNLAIHRVETDQDGASRCITLTHKARNYWRWGTCDGCGCPVRVWGGLLDVLTCADCDPYAAPVLSGVEPVEPLSEPDDEWDR